MGPGGGRGVSSGDSDFVVVANRLPIDMERLSDGTMEWKRSPGGLVTALEPVMRRRRGAWIGWPGIPDGDVHHRLLVAALVVGQLTGRQQLGLQQRLADAGDVAVAEDAEAAGEELLPLAVALAPLVGEEAHHGLGHGEPDHP